MKKYYCELHDENIILYEEGDSFIDDNRRETSIICDDEGKKYLKRFIMGKCDENCETVKKILEENGD